MDIDQIIKNCILEEKFIYGVFTTPRNKTENPYKKITARPIVNKQENIIQLEQFTDTKVFHDNLNYEAVADKIIGLIKNEYKNINIFTEDSDYQFIVSKKGSIKITESQPSKKLIKEEHNKKKQYILNENEPCPFLEYLGIMNENGQVYSKRYDKFKQIHKFL